MSPIGESAPRSWPLTPSAVSVIGAAGLLLVVGVVGGRADVAVLAVPMLLGTVWRWTRRPAGVTDVQLGSPRSDVARPRITTTCTFVVPASCHSVRVRAAAPGHRHRDVLVAAAGARPLELSLRTVRTGAQEVLEVIAQGRSEDVAEPAVRRAGPVRALVLPRAAPLGDLPLPQRLHGHTGVHASRRPGDGGDLRDIAEFRSGDRLHAIDWRSTARHARPVAGRRASLSQLYARRTYALADAHVVLVLDARDALGPDVATWSTGEVHPADATSLDVARHAAASLAEGYLDRGDRVGLLDLRRPDRQLRPAGGRRHLHRVRHHLALAAPAPDLQRLHRGPPVPAGALLVVLSTFLDDDVADLTRRWRRGGHRTIAVDVLPPARLDMLVPAARTAHRVVLMEQADRLDSLVGAGVEVLRWQPETPDVPGRERGATGATAITTDGVGTPSRSPAVTLATWARARRGGR